MPARSDPDRSCYRGRSQPLKTALCIDEFGYDAAIDYKAGKLDDALARALPHGADVYFDNTAGEISDAVRRHMTIGGRIIVCGTAAVASWDPTPQGPRVERFVLTRRLTKRGSSFSTTPRVGEKRSIS